MSRPRVGWRSSGVKPEQAPTAVSNQPDGTESLTRVGIARDPLRIMLFLLTLMTVSRVHQHYPFIAKLRPALLLTIAAAAYAYMQPKNLSRVNVFGLWPMRRITILGVLACC